MILCVKDNYYSDSLLQYCELESINPDGTVTIKGLSTEDVVTVPASDLSYSEPDDMDLDDEDE